MTESCEGTLTSPKSFKVEHIALAFVTLMLRNITDAVELEVREESSQKRKHRWLVITVSRKVSEEKGTDATAGDLGVIKDTRQDSCNTNTSLVTQKPKGEN